MSEQIRMVETATEWSRRQVTQGDSDKNLRAYGMGVTIACLAELLIVAMFTVVILTNGRGWLRIWAWEFVKVNGFSTNTHVIMFAAFIMLLVWVLVYNIVYHGCVAVGYGEVTTRPQPIKQTVTERYSVDGTEILEFDSSNGYRLNGKIEDRHEKAYHLDGMTLSGRNMHVIKLLANTGKLDRLRRDPNPSDDSLFSWNRDLPDLPDTEAGKREHYSAWINALHEAGLVNKHTGKFTEKGVIEFLGITPPPRNDNNE